MKDHINLKTGKPFPRGARPTSRAKLAASVPFYSKAAAPASFFIFPQTMSMWLNDTYGDCVTAEEAFNKACNGTLIADATVQTWASANGVLDGADLLQVIQMMEAAGFVQDGNVYGDGSPQSINYTDVPSMQAAIYQAGTQGGCVKMGVAADALPSGAGNTNGWFLTGVSPDTNEDHAMGVCGYGTAQEFATAMNAAFGLSLTVPTGIDPAMQGYAVYTWSTIGWVDTTSWANMSGEAWIRNPSSVTQGTATPAPDKVWTSEPVPPAPVPTPTPTPPPPGPPGPPPTGVTLIQLTGTITPPQMTEEQVAKLGPIMLAILQAICAAAPLLPPPYNTFALLACSLIPKG